MDFLPYLDRQAMIDLGFILCFVSFLIFIFWKGQKTVAKQRKAFYETVQMQKQAVELQQQTVELLKEINQKLKN